MNVFIINKKELTHHQEEVIESLVDFHQAIIDKNIKKLNEIISDEYTLTHMSGKKQTKQEFIDEIMDGTLNYYKSTIDSPNITANDKNAVVEAEITLDAKIYGMKGTWTLHSMQEMEKIDNKWYISKWNTMRI